MIQEKLYKKSITRSLNPAVSVADNRDRTIEVEIDEYVFTGEIINGLYLVLNGIRHKSADHNGIWISGYYGSGKSHFLKYLNFCLDKRYQEKALARLEEAVDQFDPNFHPELKSTVEKAEMTDLAQWLKKAHVDSILFNIGDKVEGDATGKTTFVKALWQEFNAFQGFNAFNIPLAKYLEKPLADAGKYDAFVQAMEDAGYDWKEDAATLAVTQLGKIAEIAKTVEPGLSYDVIYETIKRGQIDLTPQAFCAEMGQYMAHKDDNYRLVFFIDEVSQFIGDRKELILQLQQIVTGINKASDGRVWVGCTAQQDLSQLLSNYQILESSDDYGKIMGRFEKKVSLQGTDTEYITQKRILDKDEDAVVELGRLYEAKKDALSAQFKLPTGYKTYSGKQDFIDFYPFIPYQFQLIMRVLDAFVKLQYVDTEVKGNERSVLKITHKIAQDNKDDQVGKFISFDQFFSRMFEADLKNAGQKALRNANAIVDTYSDMDFARRVTRVLFMLCNLSPVDQKVFPATVDNMVTLLMTNVDENKLQFKNNTVAVLDYLKEKSVVRVETSPGAPDVWFFLSEDESEVDRLIRSQRVDSNRYADDLKGIFFKHFGNPAPKVVFNGNNFSVSWTIQGRVCLGQVNAALPVEFLVDRDGRTPSEIALQNEKKKLLFILGTEYGSSNKLRDDFYLYCQVQEYLLGGATSAQREKTNKEFKSRAQDLYEKSIVPGFKALLDKAPVAAGQTLVTSDLLGGKTGAERYIEAMRQHFDTLYHASKYVAGSEFPRTAEELKNKIKRPIDPNEYVALPLSTAEEYVENKLKLKGYDVTLQDLISEFQRDPYGWNEISTIYVVNELVRRHLRSYKYHGDPAVERIKVAETIVRDKSGYEITSAQKIDAALVEQFLESWKDIFGQVGVTYSHDSSELFHQCREADNSPITTLTKTYREESAKLSQANAHSLAKVLNDAISLMQDTWRAEHDPEKFFRLIIADRQKGKETMDRCKKVIDFSRNLSPLYKQIVEFVRENDDNFSYLPAEVQDDVVFIKKIATDEWPVDSMPSYKKRMNSLGGCINETRNTLRSQIEQGFVQVFDELVQFAALNEVPDSILPSIRNLVATKTGSKAISTLKLNLSSIPEFREQQMGRILDEKVRIEATRAGGGSGPGKGTGSEGGAGTPPPPRKVVRRISPRIIVKTPQSIKTEADIDAYVAAIRAKIKAELAGNDELVIL